MITVEVKVSGPRKDLRQLQKTLNHETLGAVAQRAADYANDRLREEFASLVPPPRDFSERIVWTSVKQGRAFFATDGFGRGIPTKRTGMTMRGFTAVRESTSSGNISEHKVIARNTTRYAPFVIGDPRRPNWQQAFHKRRGWPMAETVEAVFFVVADEIFKMVVQEIEAAREKA